MAHIVDIHTHCSPPPKGDPLGVAGAMRGKMVGKNLYSDYGGVPMIAYWPLQDFDVQQEVSHKAGIDFRLMSNPFSSEVLTNVSQKPAGDVVKHCNDEIAALVERAPDDTAGLGTVNPLDPDQIAEAERCLGPLGYKGLQIVTSWHGRYLDTEEAWPFWEWVEDKQVPIFLHPPRIPLGHDQQMDQYKLEELVGRPFDTAMSVARMILSGLFDRYPRLQICVAHMGGGLLPCMGRLDFGWRLGCDGMPDRAAIKCREMPSSYLRKNLHVDIMGVWAPHVKEAVEVFGTDRVMFGTDYGPVPVDPREHVDIVGALAISAEDKEKIFWKNANAFFRLGLN